MCKNEGLVEIEETDTRTVAGYTFQMELEALSCPVCGETYFPLGEIGRFEKQIAVWLAEEGVSEGEAFLFMRKTLGLKAAELAELLDLAPETISRWEKGHRPPEKRSLSLVASMVLDQAEGHNRTLRRLRRSLQPPPATKEVVLSLSPGTALS